LILECAIIYYKECEIAGVSKFYLFYYATESSVYLLGKFIF